MCCKNKNNYKNNNINNNKNKKKKKKQKHKNATERCVTRKDMKRTSHGALHLRARAQHMNNTNAHTTIALMASPVYEALQYVPKRDPAIGHPVCIYVHYMFFISHNRPTIKRWLVDWQPAWKQARRTLKYHPARVAKLSHGGDLHIFLCRFTLHEVPKSRHMEVR